MSPDKLFLFSWARLPLLLAMAIAVLLANDAAPRVAANHDSMVLPLAVSESRFR